MMPLPPGCTVGYEIRFYVETITEAMQQWFLLQEGEAWESEDYDWRGKLKKTKHVKYGNSKPSHKIQDGSNSYLIRFSGSDASVASLFLLKFLDDIVTHNMEETMLRYEREF